MLDTNFNIDINGDPENSLTKILVEKITGNTSYTIAHESIATGVNEYLLANLLVAGTYVGVIPAVPTPLPDPLSGDYQWPMQAMIMLGVQLALTATGGLQAWIQGIATGVKTIISSPVDSSGIITTLPALGTGIIINITIAKSIKTHKEAMNEIAKGIIQGILASVPAGGGAGKSLNALSGTVTFSTFM